MHDFSSTLANYFFESNPCLCGTIMTSKYHYSKNTKSKVLEKGDVVSYLNQNDSMEASRQSQVKVVYITCSIHMISQLCKISIIVKWQKSKFIYLKTLVSLPKKFQQAFTANINVLSVFFLEAFKSGGFIIIFCILFV